MRNYLLLHVDSPAASAAFYAALLECQPVENSSTFALFVLDSGLKLGLWSRHTVEPAATTAGGAAELGFALDDPAGLDRMHETWSGRGVRILQAPTDMDFGRSFVAEDPDGHRLRVFVLTGP